MTKPLKIILASTSNCRKNLLQQINLDFQIIEPKVKENNTIQNPGERVKINAVLKASSVAENLGKSIVLAADTVVAIDGEILGKPRNGNEAKEMLRTISGKTHDVYTGIALIDLESCKKEVKFEMTSVTIKNMSKKEIDAYVRSGESKNKAGAYSAQGLGAVFIERVEGCFYNVEGLPLSLLFDMLKRFGYTLLQ
jgi:septum formation protein